MSFSIPSVLSIAGSDSSGGAGIQADVKTIQALGLFAQTVITALTAQNTNGVTDVHDVPVSHVKAQIDAVFSDIRPQAVKIGMVSSPDIARAIAEALAGHGAQHVVVDPVMVATSGSRLMSDDAQEILVNELLPLASVITPNIPEAEALTGMEIRSEEDMVAAARQMASFTPGAVLLKAGHGEGRADDLLYADKTVFWVRGERVGNPNTHGTGCTLSSALACGLAQGMPMREAAEYAKAYIAGALAAGLDMGEGSGPLDHMWQLRPHI